MQNANTTSSLTSLKRIHSAEELPSGARQVRVANMSAINGDNIEHDVEREFDIMVEITDGGRYMEKNNETNVWDLCAWDSEFRV